MNTYQAWLNPESSRPWQCLDKKPVPGTSFPEQIEELHQRMRTLLVLM